MRAQLGAAALAAVLGACAVGPDYQRPEVETPPAWTSVEPWHAAHPDDGADRGAWWKVFGSARLDALEDEAIAHSPDLALAVEHLQQARALVTVNSAALFPELGVGVGATRERFSADRPQGSYAVPNSEIVQNDLTTGFTVHYELDLFGGNRRQAESARATTTVWPRVSISRNSSPCSIRPSRRSTSCACSVRSSSTPSRA
jgi:multidrug efflux system outer membrane protein